MLTLICFQSTTTLENDNYNRGAMNHILKPQLPKKPKTAEEIQQEKQNSNY